MVDRVKVAVDARADDGLVTTTRTNAAASEGIDATTERAIAYVEMGTNMISSEATKTLDDYHRSKAAAKVPILTNLTESGSTPLFTIDGLHSVDVDIALCFCDVYHVTDAAALNFRQIMMCDDTQKVAVETMQSRADLYQYLGYCVYEDKLGVLFAAQK